MQLIIEAQQQCKIYTRWPPPPLNAVSLGERCLSAGRNIIYDVILSSRSGEYHCVGGEFSKACMVKSAQCTQYRYITFRFFPKNKHWYWFSPCFRFIIFKNGAMYDATALYVCCFFLSRHILVMWGGLVSLSGYVSSLPDYFHSPDNMAMFDGSQQQ